METEEVCVHLHVSLRTGHTELQFSEETAMKLTYKTKDLKREHEFGLLTPVKIFQSFQECNFCITVYSHLGL